MKEQEESWIESEKRNINLNNTINKRRSAEKTSAPHISINGCSSLRSLVFLILLVNLVSFTDAQFGNLSQARSNLAAAGAGNKIVFAGGRNGTSAYFSIVDIYDVSTRTWNSTSTGAGQLSVARGIHAAAAAGNKTVFAGGSSGPGIYLATVDIYDVTTGTWNSTSTGAGQLSVARYYFAAAGAGNKIVFAGGYSAGPVSTVDIYDVTTGTWNSTSTGAGELSVARWFVSAATTGSKIIFAGGFNGSTIVSTVDIYDVSTGTWNSTSTGAGQLSVARRNLAAAATGNKIVFAGGWNGGYAATVDIYDVITGTWTSTSTGAGELSVARYALAAAATGNKIVFAGGSDGSYLSTVDIYDVSSNTWTSTSTGAGQLSVARYDLAAAGTGNVVVFAGGEDENEYLSTADIYDSQYGMHLASTTTTTAATSTTSEATITTFIASTVSTTSTTAATTTTVAATTAATVASTTTVAATVSGGITSNMLNVVALAFAAAFIAVSI